MRDRHVIIAAAILFVGLLTGPAWYARAAGSPAKGPELKWPVAEKACVMPVAFMRSSHMDLLGTWRDLVVRQGDRNWTAPDGRTFKASLTGTCLRCHSNRAEFCDRCHNYAGVTPACWDCHVDSASAIRSKP